MTMRTTTDAIMTETLSLARRESARCWAMRIIAAYKLADSMAGTPQRARALLDKVWAPARKRALEERDALQALIAEEGGNFELGALGLALLRGETAPAAATISTRRRCKPYLPAGQSDRGGLLHRRTSCSACRFRERHDIPVYHPDVRVWEVTRAGKADRPFLWRLFRPHRQAGRRLDVVACATSTGWRARSCP